MNAVHTTKPQAAKSYPNAAERGYFLEKFTDSMLCAAICVGVITILFFLVTMFI